MRGAHDGVQVREQLGGERLPADLVERLRQQEVVGHGH